MKVDLIFIKATGSPKKLAKRLEISERTLFNYLRYMREELSLPISWDTKYGIYI